MECPALLPNTRALAGPSPGSVFAEGRGFWPGSREREVFLWVCCKFTFKVTVYLQQMVLTLQN